MPFVEEAERPLTGIKPNDLNEVKKLGKPSDIIKLVFDLGGTPENGKNGQDRDRGNHDGHRQGEENVRVY